MARRFEPADNVVTAEVEGQTVLLDTKANKYFRVNAVGTMVWQLLSKGMTEEEISQAVSGNFQAPIERVTADIRNLLDQLAAKGLVRELG